MENSTPELCLPLHLKILRRLNFPKKLGSLEFVFGNILAQKGVVFAKTCAGPMWKLDLRNSTRRWIIFGDYEGPGFVPWAKKWIKEDSVVVDSGANIGQVLLYLATKIRTGKYIAVEPNPVARGWLQECLERYPNWPVTVEIFGLGATAGKASLFGHEGDSAVGSHGSLKTGDGEIEVKTLDGYCAEKGIQRVDLWKLDMEGGEEAAIQGASGFLKKQAIRALVVETDEKRFERDCENMKSYGYEVRHWNGAYMKKVRPGFYGNVLFLPEGT